MADTGISVIIPAFNSNRTLPRALASVERQTVRPREVLVVNDGGSEDVTSITRRFDLPLKVLHKENGGASSARNVGVRQATGRWVAFLDADDYWEPHKLERQAAVLALHPRVGFVTTAYFEEEPGRQRRPLTRTWRFDLDCPARVRGAALADFARATNTSSVLVARELLDSESFDENLATAEDKDLWLRILGKTMGLYISEPLTTVVLETGSLSRGRPERDYPNMLEVISRNGRLLGMYARWQWRQQVRRAWAAAHLARTDGRRALTPATSRLLHEPWSREAWWVVGKALWLGSMERVNRFRASKQSGMHR